MQALHKDDPVIYYLLFVYSFLLLAGEWLSASHVGRFLV